MRDDLLLRVRAAWVEAFAGMPAPPADAVRPSVDSDFFRAGGTSLLALVVTSELSEALGEEIPVRLLLQNPAFGAFAASVGAYLYEPDPEDEGLPQPAGGRLP
jgi:hypothetical protein